MAQTGGCMCGNVRYSVEGEPTVKALCYCTDCRKITGSTHSTNALYHASGFKVTQGTVKQYKIIADSGNETWINFCGDCGSTMWSEGVKRDPKIIKVGTLDAPDALDKAKPYLELYVPRRPDWMAAVEGAAQRDGMS